MALQKCSKILLWHEFMLRSFWRQYINQSPDTHIHLFNNYHHIEKISIDVKMKQPWATPIHYLDCLYLHRVRHSIFILAILYNCKPHFIVHYWQCYYWCTAYAISCLFFSFLAILKNKSLLKFQKGTVAADKYIGLPYIFVYKLPSLYKVTPYHSSVTFNLAIHSPLPEIFNSLQTHDIFDGVINLAA